MLAEWPEAGAPGGSGRRGRRGGEYRKVGLERGPLPKWGLHE